jgi:hypothetical protein
MSIVNLTKETIMKRLFPDLPSNIIWKEVNLNDIFLTSNKLNNVKPIVDNLEAQQKLLEICKIELVPQNKTKKNESIKTYGGFGEDRNLLWFNKSENNKDEKKQAIHLGIDFNNLEPGLSVKSLTDGTVFDILHDKDIINGWGGRVIIQTLNHHYILYGHLDPNSLPKLYQKIKVGEEVGKIGQSQVNGGWFCHLHLQYMNSKYVAPYILYNKMQDLDGYHFSSKIMPEGILNPMYI